MSKTDVAPEFQFLECSQAEKPAQISVICTLVGKAEDIREMQTGTSNPTLGNQARSAGWVSTHQKKEWRVCFRQNKEGSIQCFWSLECVMVGEWGQRRHYLSRCCVPGFLKALVRSVYSKEWEWLYDITQMEWGLVRCKAGGKEASLVAVSGGKRWR